MSAHGDIDTGPESRVRQRHALADLIGTRMTCRVTKRGRTRVIEGTLLRWKEVGMLDGNGNPLPDAVSLLLHCDNGLNVWTPGMSAQPRGNGQ